MNPTRNRSETDASHAKSSLSRRATLAGIAGTATLGGLAGLTGTTAAQSPGDGIPTPRLEVDGNLVVDPQGESVTLRGVNIADPRVMYEDRDVRGKTAPQAVDWLTNANEGWYSRIIRVPCHPWDIAGLPGVWTVRNEDSVETPEEFVCPTEECDDGYYQPPIFTEEQLQTYLEQYLDPVVERCRQNGAYCIVDFHRHWSGELHWADPDTGEPNEALSQEVERFWNLVAPRYAEDDHVLYEVYNEPTNPGMWDDPTEQSWVADTWHDWKNTAQPWVDTIREHAPETIVLIGSPGWTQSPEGALVEPFDGENLAYTYHIYAQHDVSVEGTWADAGPNGEGTKRVYEEHPLFVTEWGWGHGDTEGIDNVRTDVGEPFVEWMEESDAIHWQAWGFYPTWGADVTVQPTFDGECADPPCEWEVVPGEETLGPFVKEKLAEYADDNVPTRDETEETCGGQPVEGTATVDGRTVCDVDGDGLYRDVTGDGSVGQTDVVEFFQNQHREPWKQPARFDFSGDGSVGHGDVVELFEHVATQ